jgi:hypothetical protein
MKKESKVQTQRPMKDVTPKKPPQATIQKGKDPHPPRKPAPRRKRAGTAVAIAQAPKEAKNVLAIIADAAANPAVNPGVMRELLDMQKEIMAEQSKRDFNAAFIALQRELPTIRRDGKIEIREKVAGERVGRVQQATPYATFNAIMGAIKPLLVKHGFALSFETEPMAERLLVKGRLEGHGHERTTAFPLPAETSGSKNNVQGWGSSMSYGKRYCTIALLNIISEAQEDRDTDGNENKPTLKDAKGGGFVEVPDRPKVTEEQAIALRDLIEWCGVGTRKFVEHYGIKTVADLPADLFSAAEKDCKDYHANQQGKARG